MSLNNILIVAPAWIGDMVMAQSLFKLIKQRHPAARLDVLASAWTGSLVACMPEVDQLIVSPFGHGELRLLQRFQLGRQLRFNRYDQAIVVPRSFKSSLVPAFARIPRRTGWVGEMRFGLLNDMRFHATQYPLMVERFAALALEKHEPLKRYPWPQLRVDAEAQHKTLQKFGLKQTTMTPILGICPGAEYGPAKRWPATHFAKLVQAKTKEGWQVWIFGSAKDAGIAAEIQAACDNQGIDLTGKTSLNEAIHLLAATDAVVANDSGLMHITAALNKPLVAIYGSTPPGLAPPLSKKAESLSLQLSCSPCYRRECPLQHLNCLNQLAPQRVLESIEKLQNSVKI